MIGEIVSALLAECKALFVDTPATVVLRTQFKFDNVDSYSMPFLLLDVIPGGDDVAMIGGATMMYWNFAFNTYSHEPNSSVNDDTGQSENLLNFIDKIRRHFQIGKWLTPNMVGIENDYGFKLTFGGMHNADPIEQDGVIMGFKSLFESAAIDTLTDQVQDSIVPLQYLIQIQNLLTVMSFPLRSLSPFTLLNISASQTFQIAANTFIDSIGMGAVTGAPVISIGTTPGGTDIVNAVTPGAFNRAVVEQLIANASTWYITISGGGTANISFMQVLGYFE